MWFNCVTNEYFSEETGNEENPMPAALGCGSGKDRKWTRYRYEHEKCWWHNSTTEEYFFEETGNEENPMPATLGYA